jgi:arylsulfatase A-like enzyme
MSHPAFRSALKQLAVALLGTMSLGLVTACSQEDAAAESPTAFDSRPNILLIVADDLGFGDLAKHGGPQRTPALLALAASGLQLDQFHAFPLCTPSRAALLTRRSPLRHGLAWSPLRPWSELGLPAQTETLPEALQAAGYATALVGKWHLGHTRAEHQPKAHGFEHFYGFLTGAVDYFSHESRDGGVDWQRNGSTLHETGYVTELLTQEGVRLIHAHDFKRPLFLMMSYSAPHWPMQAPEASQRELAEIADPDERVYAAMLLELDRGIARLQAELEARGQTSNTLQIFLSDNGAALNLGGSNGELKGGKSVVLQGGLRVPAILAWPGHTIAASHDAGFVSVLDLAPTLASLAGAKLKEADGRSHAEAWFGGAAELLRSAPDDAPPTVFVAHNETRGQMAIFDGPWKLVRRLQRDGSPAREQLFRIDQDPTESDNLIDAQPQIAERMRNELAVWLALDPNSINLDSLPAWDGDAPANWKAPAEWAGAVH